MNEQPAIDGCQHRNFNLDHQNGPPFKIRCRDCSQVWVAFPEAQPPVECAPELAYADTKAGRVVLVQTNSLRRCDRETDRKLVVLPASQWADVVALPDKWRAEGLAPGGAGYTEGWNNGLEHCADELEQVTKGEGNDGNN